MSSNRICLASLALALFLFPGCMGDDKKQAGAQPSRARFMHTEKSDVASGRQKNPDKSRPDSRGRNDLADADLSPEASMRRDLNRLVEKEREQTKKVKEMQTYLAEGEDAVRKETTRLDEIRGQIENYDNAIKRFDMAGASSGGAKRNQESAWRNPLSRKQPTANRAAGAHEDANAANLASRQAPAGAAYDNGFGAPGYGSQGGEVMVYNGAGQSQYAMAPEPAAPSRGGYDPNAPAPYAGATVAQARREPGTIRSNRVEEDEWNPPTTMYGSTGDVAAMVPPARQAKAPMQIQVRAPGAAPAPVQPSAQPLRPASVAEPTASHSGDDVFSPDLFLN